MAHKIAAHEFALLCTHLCQLGRFILTGSCGGNGNSGLTPEVLEFVAKEAAQRESGDGARADLVKGEALKAR